MQQAHTQHDGGHDAHQSHEGPEGHTGHGAHEEHAGHGGHAGHGDHAAMFRRKFWLTFALSIPVIAYSHMIQEWLGFTAPHFPGSRWVAPVLGTFIFFYGGWPFLTGGWDEAKRRRPGMMLLIALAITVAFVASVATTFGYLEGLDFGGSSPR